MTRDIVMYEDMIGVIDISKEDMESDQERLKMAKKSIVITLRFVSVKSMNR